MAEVQSLRSRFLDWLGGTPDDDVLRWLYRCLLATTVTIVALDYSNLHNTAAERTTALPSTEQPSAQPLPARKFGGGRAAPFGQPDAALRDKMTFELEGDSRLKATGTIMPGTAEKFAAEIAKRGSYIKTVVLRSPGGSVRDALAMGRLIRQKQFSMEVAAAIAHPRARWSLPAALSATLHRTRQSGCTRWRRLAVTTCPLPPVCKMLNRFRRSANKFLRDMGIDLEVWIRAMETPREELYYFQPTELLTLKLATVVDDAKSRGDTPQKRRQN